MALSAAQMQEAVIRNMPVKTGRTLEEWISIARSFEATGNRQMVEWLKKEFNLGHVQAQTIAWRMDGQRPYIETTGYEEKIFSGEGILPRYFELKALICSLGRDVKARPCKTYIPFYRKNQFAILTQLKGELVLGLNLGSDVFQELAHAEKIGGSARINRMLIIRKDMKLSTITKYIKESYKRN